MPEPNFNIAQAHRWFAVECNNRAWELVESSARSAEETAEMISAAHAAALHWQAVGRPINQLWAECLLATAYAAVGWGEPAVYHAQRCLELSRKLGDEQNAFDRAAAHGSAANAFASVGDAERTQVHHQKMLEISATLADADEQSLLSKLYGAIASY